MRNTTEGARTCASACTPHSTSHSPIIHLITARLRKNIGAQYRAPVAKGRPLMRVGPDPYCPLTQKIAVPTAIRIRLKIAQASMTLSAFSTSLCSLMAPPLLVLVGTAQCI
ncbi:conserved protein of unknown function [Ectopseudomonas oleovorans]|uniref:Uncharacterized protein n=1 Tax=Ectopseudomonas oleovorans TaxID=301 RepID=A0A653BCA0_ECTOL|nr:conserved protein of unknown function [Pseudomonas oleovorans]